MKLRLFISALAMSAVVTGAQAASPKSFKAGETPDSKIVVCSNKAERLLVKKESQWCNEADYCSKSRMKVAKKACKIKG